MSGSPTRVSASFESTFALPLFLTHKNKYLYGLLVTLIAPCLYLFSNHHHFFPPQYLPMTWVDRIVPFVPWTVWIYISEYVYFWAIYVACRDMANLNKYLYAFIALQTVSVAIFLLWPTTYPRDLFPLPDSLGSWTHYAFSTLRETDSPANCCPSLHISSVFLTCFILIDEQREKFLFFFIWGVLIALSTLTTKQHYLVDIVTGFMMTAIFYSAFFRYVPYRALQAKR